MKRLEELYPTFNVTKTADVELGRRLSKMGYERKRNSRGSAFVLQELWCAEVKQLVLPSLSTYLGQLKWHFW